MAETVYLNDGSTEVVFTDRQTFLERLIREKLGFDAARFFLEYVAEASEDMEIQQSSAEEKERIADSYSRMCHDAMDCFQRISQMLDAPRLDRAKLKAAVQEGFDDLYKNL